MTAVLPIPALTGTLQYEARMVVRRRVLWFVVGPLALLALLITWRPPGEIDDGVRFVGGAALVAGILCNLGVGVAFADRLARSRRPGLTELVAATPCSAAMRLPAMLAAPLGVALLPPLLVVAACAVPAALADGGPRPLGAALFAFAVIVLPGALLAAAFASLLGLLLPAALTRVVTAGAWLWATIASPPLLPFPTPTGTLLSPVGGYPAAAWFGESPVWAHREQSGMLSPPVAGWSALANLGVVAVLSILLAALSGLILTSRR